MFKIKTLNAISDVIHEELSAEQYVISPEEPVPEGILVRSAVMHDAPLNPELLGIARAGAGVNNIPLDKCTKQGIAVFNTPGANANAVAELVLGALVLGSRNVAAGIRWADTLKGQENVPKLVEKGKGQFVGPELRGKTLGVIGLGAIGRLVANAASAGFGMKVVGCDPFISVESAWALSSSVRRAATNEDVFAQVDYITFHVPLNDKTRGSINAATIAKMKKGAILLNFSRGELANTADVKAALASGQLGGYVTDFPCEELLGVEKVTCIPHLGASTLKARTTALGWRRRSCATISKSARFATASTCRMCRWARPKASACWSSTRTSRTWSRRLQLAFRRSRSTSTTSSTSPARTLR